MQTHPSHEQASARVNLWQCVCASVCVSVCVNSLRKISMRRAKVAEKRVQGFARKWGQPSIHTHAHAHAHTQLLVGAGSEFKIPTPSHSPTYCLFPITYPWVAAAATAAAVLALGSPLRTWASPWSTWRTCLLAASLVVNWSVTKWKSANVLVH